MIQRSEVAKSVQLFVTPWTVAYEAPLSMEFSRQEYWSGLPYPSPGDLPDPGIEPRSPTWEADALPSEPPGKPDDPEKATAKQSWRRHRSTELGLSRWSPDYYNKAVPKAAMWPCAEISNNKRKSA